MINGVKGRFGRLLTIAGVPTAATLGAAILVRVAGLGRQAIVARVFGLSAELDLYVAALVIPTFAGNVLGVAFNAAAIPYLTAARHDGGSDAESQALRHTLRLAFLLGCLLSLILVALAPLLLQLVAPTAGEGPSSTLVARVAALVTVLAVLTQVLTAACLVRRRFFLTAISTAAVPISVALAALIHGANTQWLMIGTAFGHLAVVGILGAGLARSGALRGHQRTPPLQRFPWTEIAAMTLAVAATGAAGSIDRMFASRIGVGALSSLEIGTRLPESFEGLIGVVIANVGGATLASAALSTGRARFARNSRTYASTMMVMLLIPTALLIWITPPLVDLLYGGGQFTAESAEFVSAVQRGSLARIPFYLGVLFLVRSLNSINQSWTVARVLTVFAIFSVVLDLLLIPVLGVAGITWATAAGYALASALLLWLMGRGRLRPHADQPPGSITKGDGHDDT